MEQIDPPAKVASNDQLGPNVTAWVCEYMSGEVFVSLAANPMNDPDVRKAWRLLTMAQRDSQVAAAVATERSEVARLRAALADVVDTDWAFLGRDADTANPDSLYCRVRRGRVALGPNAKAERPETAAPE